MAWARETRVFVNAKFTEDYRTYESFFEHTAMIFRVPTGQKLEMKPEGQRRWNTETIYTDTTLDLSVDDIIYFDDETDKKYRVLNKTDYKNFGFNEYEITTDYT